VAAAQRAGVQAQEAVGERVCAHKDKTLSNRTFCTIGLAHQSLDNATIHTLAIS
jgi:hypothetical protein